MHTMLFGCKSVACNERGQPASDEQHQPAICEWSLPNPTCIVNTACDVDTIQPHRRCICSNTATAMLQRQATSLLMV
jgi:hypothetical protein